MKTGATVRAWIVLLVGIAFQSSPVGEDGCDGSDVVSWLWCSSFQSSPVGEDGCEDIVADVPVLAEVSILTRR